MAISEYFILSLFIFLGIVAIVASGSNADWFFKTSSASTFVHWLGRGGARIFYILLGIVLIACGITGFIHWK